MTRDRIAKLGWIAAATWVLLYAPVAFEYMSRFFFSGPALWDHVYSGVVGQRQALGHGSIYAVQSGRYRDNAVAMVVHTTLGASAVALAVYQLSARSRRRLATHRRLGRVLLPIVIVAMLAAMTFLVSVGTSGTFDGAAFNLQLWALALATAASAVLGWVAIRRRQVGAHQILMSYMFALLTTAPFLRLGYLVLGLAWPHSTQEVSNLAGAAILGFLAPSSAVVVARFVRAPRTARHPGRLITRPRARALAAAAVLGTAVLAWQYAAQFDGLDRVTLTWVLTGLLVAGVAARLRATATRDQARADWTIYLASLALSPAVTLVLWGVYSLAFSVSAAFYGALLTGPPLAVTIGVLALVSSRCRRDPAGTSSVPVERVELPA